MKHLAYILSTFVSSFIVFQQVHAQHPPFYNEIQQFKKADSIAMPPGNAILFTGSSSFTKWTDVGDYFPGYTIINRGFGGSSLPDVIRYADDIIFAYHPSQVVIYCGENDLAGSDTVSADHVVARFTKLFEMIRSRLPEAGVAFVSMKPSPSRMHLKGRIVEANARIRDFLAGKKNTDYIDVYSKMLNPDGSPMSQIFVGDSLHMNAKGYAIWKKAFQPYLKK